MWGRNGYLGMAALLPGRDVRIGMVWDLLSAGLSYEEPSKGYPEISVLARRLKYP